MKALILCWNSFSKQKTTETKEEVVNGEQISKRKNNYPSSEGSVLREMPITRQAQNLEFSCIINGNNDTHLCIVIVYIQYLHSQNILSSK